jgi:hypothetical protein
MVTKHYHILPAFFEFGIAGLLRVQLTKRSISTSTKKPPVMQNFGWVTSFYSQEVQPLPKRMGKVVKISDPHLDVSSARIRLSPAGCRGWTGMLMSITRRLGILIHRGIHHG